MSRSNSSRVFAAVLGTVLCLPLAVLLTSKPSPAKTPSLEGEREFTLEDWPMTESAKRGREVYKSYCIGCHGQEGRGDGEAIRFLRPLPRDFQHGAFKFRSTPTGKLPTMDDLVKTITCGLPGSSMPGFPLVAESQRRDVAGYVLHLATLRYGRIAVERMAKRGRSIDEIIENDIAQIRDDVWKKRVTDAETVTVPPAPRVTPELLETGRLKYLGECNRCHGDQGLGDGPSSFTLRDWKDDEILARDFTSGVFRAGSAPADLFKRLKTGLNGTPMPSIPGTDDEIWGLVYFMLSLIDDDAAAPRLPAGCAHGGER